MKPLSGYHGKDGDLKKCHLERVYPPLVRVPAFSARGLSGLGSDAGNFFFAGARLFFRSLESAIFLFSRVARIPEGSLVLPVIRTEGNITLGAELANGTIIRGQNQISHPSEEGASSNLANIKFTFCI